MKTLLIVFAAALLTAPMAFAQTTYSHTLPFGYEGVDGNYTCYPAAAGGGPFNINPGNGNCRWQWIYGWNQFFHQHPVLITQLDFRRSSDANLVAVTFNTVTITMASLAPAISSHTTV